MKDLERFIKQTKRFAKMRGKHEMQPCLELLEKITWIWPITEEELVEIWNDA